LKYTLEQQQDILRLHSEGRSSRKISKATGLSKSGINYFLARNHSQCTTAPELTKPKILLLDLESAPSIVAAFGRFKQNISQDAVINEGGWLLTGCAKWLGESDVIRMKSKPSDYYANSDYYLVAEVYKLIEQSDLVIAHNADNFDIPLLKARMLVNGYPAMKKVRTIDTLKIARQLRFNSNKLDSLCSQLEIGRKLDHSGIDLWLRCMNGDMEAVDKMLEYNAQDVLLLEQLYFEIRAYDTKHPNLSVYYNDDKLHCNVCGGTNLVKTENSVYTNLSAFDEYICEDCSARLRNRTNKLSKDKRKSLLST